MSVDNRCELNNDFFDNLMPRLVENYYQNRTKKELAMSLASIILDFMKVDKIMKMRSDASSLDELREIPSYTQLNSYVEDSLYTFFTELDCYDSVFNSNKILNSNSITADGYIYIFEFGNKVKIGRSKNTKRHLQVASCNAERLGKIKYFYVQNTSIELDIHKHLKKYRVHGEYFLMTFEDAFKNVRKYLESRGAIPF